MHSRAHGEGKAIPVSGEKWVWHWSGSLLGHQWLLANSKHTPTPPNARLSQQAVCLLQDSRCWAPGQLNGWCFCLRSASGKSARRSQEERASVSSGKLAACLSRRSQTPAHWWQIKGYQQQAWNGVSSNQQVQALLEQITEQITLSMTGRSNQYSWLQRPYNKTAALRGFYSTTPVYMNCMRLTRLLSSSRTPLCHYISCTAYVLNSAVLHCISWHCFSDIHATRCYCLLGDQPWTIMDSHKSS